MAKIIQLHIFQLLIITTIFSQPDDYTLAKHFLESNGQNPAQYLVDRFGKNDVVLLAEDHGIKQNLDFVVQLIPILYENGVYCIGMEFGAKEMQKKLDSLASSESYDENLAREMMFFYNAGWAYKEYMDIYRAVWIFNSMLDEGEKKFRVLNLSYQYNWEEFRGKTRTPEMMKKVFWMGTPDKFRAEIIEKEIFTKNEKILVLAGLPHTFTKFRPCSLNFNNDNFCQYDNNWLGNRLYDKYKDKVATVVLHRPFWNYPNRRSSLISPANGVVEQLMNANDNEPVGFDLGNSPIGKLPDNSIHSLGYENFTIGQIADGYIFLVPIKEMTGCSIDYKFFADKKWETIKTSIPDPDWRGDINSIEGFWKQIEEFVDLEKRYKELEN